MASIEVCKQLSTYSYHSKIWDLVELIDEETTVEEFDEMYNQLSKPSLNVGARCGNTVMGVAATYGNVALVEHLYKVDGIELLNLGNEFGMTPLYCAVLCGQYETAKKLIELGAKVNLATCTASDDTITGISERHSTPLWMAVHNKDGVHSDLVRLLVSNGGIVNPPLKEKYGKILADILEEEN